MRARIALATLLAIAGAAAVQAAGQDTPQANRVKGDAFEQVSPHVFKVTGNVELTVGGISVRADVIELHTTGPSDDDVVDFVAQGRVVLTRGSERLTVERLQLNPRTGSGSFDLGPSSRP
jgi:lipopolysaccharide export system protein LptA